MNSKKKKTEKARLGKRRHSTEAEPHNPEVEPKSRDVSTQTEVQTKWLGTQFHTAMLSPRSLPTSSTFGGRYYLKDWWFTHSGSQQLDDPMKTAELIERGAELLFRMFKVYLFFSSFPKNNI